MTLLVVPFAIVWRLLLILFALGLAQAAGRKRPTIPPGIGGRKMIRLHNASRSGILADMTAKTWIKSRVEGNYISADGRYTAELRPAGYYAEFGCKLARHYAIRQRGSDQIIGTARTLKEAAATYL